MFTLKTSEGDHKIFEYNIQKHPFIKYFNNLYNEEKLDMLHLKSSDYNYLKDKLELGGLNEIDTDLHIKFYDDIKSNTTFKKLYCNFIKDIYDYFFPNEEYMIFQSFPSIRLQFMKSVSVPPHKDSDQLSNHPLGEKNFLVPITEMINTNSIYIESKPDKEDFKSIHLLPGELFYFNANTCTHYNEPNNENKLRISLDFRVILYKDYIKYLNFSDLKKTNPRDLQRKRKPTLMLIGSYYQCFHRNTSLNNMMDWYKIKHIMQHRPTFEKEEAEATYKYMLEDSFITEYKKTEELEKIISTYLNCKHCIMTTSGTCAIILSLMALELNVGDEVVVPNYTMIATVNAIKMLKLKPVIIDVDKETFTINLDTIKKNISNKTKAIIHVSLNNRYKNMNELLDFCNTNNYFLVEDSAQSLGCRINGKNLGTFGNIGCFSLSSPKIISTGQGGFCVTDDDVLANKIRMIKNFGRKESGKDNFEVFGINLKFTDLQAVIGIEQMKKLDFRVKRMREIYNLYYSELKDTVIMREPLNHEWLPWFVDIFTNKRKELVDFLKKHKVSTRPVYGEINKTKMYYNKDIFVNSQYVSNNGLFLPSYITIDNNTIKHICKLIKLFYNNYEKK
jgi:perosamine synthetase